MSAIEASSVGVRTMADAALYKRLVLKATTNEDTGCWEWSACRSPNGYGAIQIDGRKAHAHRAMWQAVHGPIKVGLFICHRCDNRPCINPAHLFLGTPSDNARDREAKGRSNTPRGARNHMSALSDAEVKAVAMRYASGERAADLARECKVSLATIRNWARRHCVKDGRKGERNGRAKLRDADVQDIERRLAAGESQLAIGRLYGVSGHPIWRIANGKRTCP